MSEIVGRRSSNWDLLPEGENGDEGRDTGWISWREYVKKGGGTRREEMSPSSGMWEREGDYTASMSPGLDSWRELSCSRSARNKWGSRSHRSRSRSPIHGSRSESERWPERNKNGARGSNLPCKDFASGRCRRGSQCRFLHEIYDGSRRHYDSALSESRGGDRLENRFSSGSSYPTNQAFEDVHDLHKDGNKFSIPCADSERGRCQRGSACKYVHRSSDDNYGGGGDSSYDKRDGFVYFGRGQRSERERRTISHVLCKFFENGRCRNGDNCKFSHGGSGRIEPEERPTDPWQVHNTGSENRLRDDPLMGDKAGDKHAHNSPNWKSYTNNTREGEQGWLPRPGKASVKTISNSPQWQRENDIGISTELNKDGETCKWDKNMGKENRLKEDRCWSPPPDKNMGKENRLKDDLGWSLSPDNASVKKISNSPQWQRKNDTSRISTEMNKDGETREWVHNMGTENRLIDDRMPGDKAGDRHASGSLCWRSLANDNREEEQGQSLWSVKKASHSPQGESPGGGSPTTTNRKKEQGWSMWSVKKASHSPQGKSAGWERPTITNKEKEQGWSTRSVEKASLSPQGHSAGWERSTNTNSEKEQGSSPWSVKKASHSPQEQSHGWGSPTNTNKEKEQGWSLGPDNASVIKISNSPQWQKENNTGIPTSLNNDGETRKWVHNLGEESRLKDDAMMDDKAGDKHVDSSPKYRNTNNTTEERGWPPLPDTVSLKKASNSSQWQRENYTSGTSTEVNKDGEIHYTLRGDSTQNSFVHVQTNYPDGLMRQPLQGQVPELHGSRDAIQRPETELNKQTQLSTPGYSAVASFQSQKPIQLQLFPQKIDQISALNALSSSVQQPGRKVDERNFICSPLNLRATAAPSSVISDQVPQLTESASLAQVLANRTNLSQLYASLSSLHSNPNSSNLLRPLDLKPEHHEKQYDPLSDNLDPVDVDADSHLPESSCIPEGKHLAIEETQQFSIGLEQSTVTSWPNDIDLLNVCSSEEEEEEAGQCKNEEEKQLEQSKRSAETETKKEVKEKAADATEDKEGVEEEKEEDKRSKSVKGARMFKFALVAFVKEILKPTWKEGQMSREVHKTIVKKVVDKVTSSTRSASIQHTQENIDSYLSHSKPKVTKLIQAYVEKYNKT